MRAFIVVDPQPASADLAHLLEIVKHVGVEHFIAETAIIALDVAFLGGVAGLNVARIDAVVLAPVEQPLSDELGVVVQASAAGNPRNAASRSSTRTSSLAGWLVLVSMAKPSRTPSPNRFNTRNRRPLRIASLMKSSPHTAFTATGTVSGCASRCCNRFFILRGRFNHSSQCTRYSRLGFHQWPWLCNRSKHFQKPQSRFRSTIALSASTRGASSFAQSIPCR